MLVFLVALVMSEPSYGPFYYSMTRTIDETFGMRCLLLDWETTKTTFSATCSQPCTVFREKCVDVLNDGFKPLERWDIQSTYSHTLDVDAERFQDCLCILATGDGETEAQLDITFLRDSADTPPCEDYVNTCNRELLTSFIVYAVTVAFLVSIVCSIGCLGGLCWIVKRLHLKKLGERRALMDRDMDDYV